MGRVHVVVDGSNIATEGRTAPSLAQLDDAVRAFIEHYGHDKVTVIVDATFGHRIDPSEVPAFEEAILAGELVTPPAGTIGRGDAFILEVARRADADVLSNDSFQELHAEHPWLFEAGRLWGGKPVPSVGWVFVARAPVRGITSRRVTQAAKRAAKSTQAPPPPEAVEPIEAKAPRRRRRGAGTAPEPSAPGTPATTAKRGSKATGAAAAAEPDVDEAAPTSKRRRRRGSGEVKREPVNEQLVYASFVVSHPVGSTVRGSVERFSSHGAYVRVDGAAGYIPLRDLGDPPPRSAREVLSIGEERDFVVTRFDPAIRGIDVVPADVAGAPTTSAAPSSVSDATEAAAPAVVASETDAEEAPVSPAAKKTAAKKRATAKKATARKSTAKKATAKRAAAKKAAPRKAAVKKTAAKKKSAAKKATARKATAKKSTARKSTAKKATAKKKATARKATAKKATAKRSTAKRAAKKR